jgi:hypothetical protein
MNASSRFRFFELSCSPWSVISRRIASSLDCLSVSFCPGKIISSSAVASLARVPTGTSSLLTVLRRRFLCADPPIVDCRAFALYLCLTGGPISLYSGSLVVLEDVRRAGLHTSLATTSASVLRSSKPEITERPIDDRARGCKTRL